MVIIRLARSGAKKNPYYFITVADERRPRDGAFIERLGFFNPSAKGQEERLRIDLEKLEEWVSKGAQVSDRIKSLIKESKLTPEEYAAKVEAKKVKAQAKKAALAEKLAKEVEAQAAEAAKLIQQMKTIEAATALIQSRAEQLLKIIDELGHQLKQALPQLELVVSRETDWRRLQLEEQQSVAVITSLAYVLKQLIDAQLFDGEGNPIEDTQKLMNTAILRWECGNV